MRYLILLSALTLSFCSCSNQKEIEKYQKQLRESNEALEDVIEYRRHAFKMAANENPAKATIWLELSESYSALAFSLVESWPNNPAGTKNSLAMLDSLDKYHFKEKCSIRLNLNSLSANDSLIVKSRVLNHLNTALTRFGWSTNVSDGCGWSPLLSKPVVFSGADSSLILVTSNVDRSVGFSVNFNNDEEINFRRQYSMGYFVVKTDNLPIAGNVEFNFENALSHTNVDFKIELDEDSIKKL